MDFNAFVGIDVSKADFHVFIHSQGIYGRFSNTLAGFDQFVNWLKQETGLPIRQILIGFENTGIYSLNLSMFLSQYGYSYTILNGLDLKRSLGIQRSKSDQVDAKNIAQYVYERKERIKLYQMPSNTLQKLKKLLSFRERLVKENTAYKNRLKEYQQFLCKDDYELIFEAHLQLIEQFSKQISKVEQKMLKLIQQDEKLFKQFNLINSIKSVGPQTALTMIVLTNGFSQFDNWRQFASYAGTAPFPNQSGTFNGRTKVSNLANKRIKTLLSSCATSAIKHNVEMKIYYQRRIEQGKNHMSTINVIRNKIIARIFAVVKRQAPYVDILAFAK